MSEMYKYLEQHAYISENKKSNYQFELSKERAEAIANKCDNLLQQKDNIIKEVNDYIESDKFYNIFYCCEERNKVKKEIKQILDKENSNETK